MSYATEDLSLRKPLGGTQEKWKYLPVLLSLRCAVHSTYGIHMPIKRLMNKQVHDVEKANLIDGTSPIN
jgi:hypothetical protein